MDNTKTDCLDIQERSVIENSALPIIVFQLKGNFHIPVAASKEAFRFFGLPEDASIDDLESYVYRNIKADEVKSAIHIHRYFFDRPDGTCPFTFKIHISHLPGWRSVYTHGNSRLAPDGTRLFYVTLSDITQTLEDQTTDSQGSAFLNSADEILSITGSGVLKFKITKGVFSPLGFTDELAKIFNCPANIFLDFLTEKDRDIVAEKYPSISAEKFIETFETYGQTTSNICVYTFDSQILWINLQISYLSSDTSGNPLYIAVITPLSKSHAALMEELFTRQHLETNHQSEFIARMSHDMRTPLSAIFSTSEFGMQESKDEYERDYFKQIRQSSKYLLEVMNDILDIQKLKNSRLEIIPRVENPKNLVDNICNIIHAEVARKNITFTHTFSGTSSAYTKIDGHRASQIMISILSNAIKFTPEGGTITWNTESFKDALGNHWKVHTVSDNGIGMSKEFQKKMYQSFTQAHSNCNQYEAGTGLGLAIAKKLLDQMGGDIQCASRLGYGTTFTVTLPYDEPTQEEIDFYLKSQAEPDSGILKGFRILLCEDMVINCRIIRKILESYGVILSIAENGIQGVEMAAAYSYDAILMDIRMPVMDGLEAATAIRAFDKRTPIIALSANAYEDDIKKSKQAGMNAHLSKPINRNVLVTTIAKFAKSS